MNTQIPDASFMVDTEHIQQLCFDNRALSLFLRQSRTLSDDTISSRLSPGCCDETQLRILSEWSKRDGMLRYCASLTHPESNLSSSTSSKSTSPVEQPVWQSTSISELARTAREHISFAASKTDPRLDAYTARDELQPVNRTEDVATLAETVAREMQCEEIIRQQTADVFARKCDKTGVEPTLLQEYQYIQRQ